MYNAIAVARTYDCEFVGAASGMRKEIGDVDAALPVFGESAGAAEGAGIGLNELVVGLPELGGPRLSVQSTEQRLGIERFQMAWTAGHEQEDDRVRSGPPASHLRIGTDAFIVQH